MDGLSAKRIRFFEQALWILGLLFSAVVWFLPIGEPLFLHRISCLIGALFFAVNFSAARFLLQRMLTQEKKRVLYATLYATKLACMLILLGVLVLVAHVSVPFVLLGFAVFPSAVILTLFREFFS